MLFARDRLYVGLDAASVSGAVVEHGLGRPRLRACVRVPLEAGALRPSPAAVNLAQPEVVRAALETLRRDLGPPSAGGAVTLVLPEGVGRVADLELDAGADPRELVRFRLAARLPYPPAEAIVDVRPLPGGRGLAGAVRRSVVAEYEAVAAASGFGRGRVDVSSLLALDGCLRAGLAPTVVALLGDASVCLAVVERASVRALRQRRRDPSPGEPQRLAEEAERTAAQAGAGALPLAVLGSGAAALVREWGRELHPPTLPPGLSDRPEAAELAWLGAVLA